MNGFDDWQAGDLALCVNADRLFCRICGRHHLGGGHRKGEVVEVATVGVGPLFGDPLTLCPVPVLKSTDGRNGLSTRFRKIRPHVPDAEDARTIALLTGKPAKVEA